MTSPPPSLDLHPIFRSNRDIELAMRQFLFRAKQSGAPMAEIIPGRGSGQLRQRVLTFLDQRHIRRLYARREVDPKNPGRVLIWF
ncbi:DNA mismatch repair protein MutS [Mangrovactinospora gilvigrisea]|uniref:DNA mismatch repair protein MutS n=1 Tax=Mangrovactinospora gilvigrisea TaxID=1428644 RepID=A0A1J7BCI0_9ACTN|nr:Smr/MutS family protein [Mangrovactinospora gilvigrisea]OIV36293.1 DNA mismatch repair protein MutS [Mangrovactinospora gilvigrisea]